MTDKEWKEICDWVKSLNSKLCFIDNSDEEVILVGVGDDSPHIFGGGYLEITKNGEVIEYDCEILIVKNRSQKQIKAIIKNLIEEANND